LNKEQQDNIEELKSCFESAIGYCNEILINPENSKSEFQWLIHDWSVKQQDGYNDALMMMFDILYNTYQEYHPE